MVHHVETRAARQLRALSRFHHAAELTPAVRRQMFELALEPDEACIGVYVSGAPDYETAVAVTTKALHVRRGERWVSTRYEQIESVEVPRGANVPGQFVLHRLDGGVDKVRLTVLPEHAQDVHAFAIFVDVVRDDLVQYRGTGGG